MAAKLAAAITGSRPSAAAGGGRDSARREPAIAVAENSAITSTLDLQDSRSLLSSKGSEPSRDSAYA